MCKEDEERITNLEIKLAYAEETIAQLNQVVTTQQKDLGIMENHVNKLEKKVVELMENSDIEERPSRRPPHY